MPWRNGVATGVRPDFVFPERKVAVFVDGCFWHGCPRHVTWPAHRAAWWRRKLEGNRVRDRKVNRALRAAGWRVVRLWEHELAERGTRSAERGTPETKRQTRNAERGTPSTQRGTRIAERGLARIRKALTAASGR